MVFTNTPLVICVNKTFFFFGALEVPRRYLVGYAYPRIEEVLFIAKWLRLTSSISSLNFQDCTVGRQFKTVSCVALNDMLLKYV